MQLESSWLDEHALAPLQTLLVPVILYLSSFNTCISILSHFKLKTTLHFLGKFHQKRWVYFFYLSIKLTSLLFYHWWAHLIYQSFNEMPPQPILTTLQVFIETKGELVTRELYIIWNNISSLCLDGWLPNPHVSSDISHSDNNLTLPLPIIVISSSHASYRGNAHKQQYISGNFVGWICIPRRWLVVTLYDAIVLLYVTE